MMSRGNKKGSGQTLLLKLKAGPSTRTNVLGRDDRDEYGRLWLADQLHRDRQLTTDNFLYCRNIFFAMKSTFAGRSARRRMK